MKGTHRLSRHPLYRVWSAMKRRCNNELYPKYKLYGGAGVRVCKEWEDDFMSFCKWAMSNGWQKGLQVDKDIIPSKLGKPALLYSPQFCSIVTVKENHKCKRGLREITYNGKKMTVSDWSRELGMSVTGLFNRLRRWPIEKALSYPVQKNFIRNCKKK